MRKAVRVFLVACSLQPGVLPFSVQPDQTKTRATVLSASQNDEDLMSRRNILSSLATIGISGFFLPDSALAADGAESQSESFASIAARANQISKEVDAAPQTSQIRKTDKTLYDFDIPVEGKVKPMMEVVQQQFGGASAKVKAVLVVNIKQDDPVARKNIPELISLATK